jgi:heptaprenyl diphosphate synthase
VVISTATFAAGIDFGDSGVAGCVRGRMTRIDDLIRSQLDDDTSMLTEAVLRPSGPTRRQIRPLITVLCAQLGDNPDAWEVTAAGAATEMVHMAALHHDDVEDDAHRGVRSDCRWRNSMAILAGDYLLAAASQVLSGLGPAAVAAIAETFAQMMEGRMRIHRRLEGPAVADDALRAAMEKTGSLIATAGRFGATFGGVAPADIGRITKLSGFIGLALQISDDVRDLTEVMDPSETPVSLSKTLHTLPAQYALQESGTRAARLHKLVRNGVDRDTRSEAVTLIRASTGFTKAIDVCTRYATEAGVELLRLPDSPARYALAQLVDYVRKRFA